MLPTLPVNVVGNLRTLSLSLRNGALIPSVYTQITALETLDFYGSHVKFTDHTLFDGIRGSNVSSLSFRDGELSHIAPGTFSNMSHLRSLIFCCYGKLGLKEAIAQIAQTRNSNIDTVVLDRVEKSSFSVFNTAELCSSFWRKSRRLSVKDNFIIAFVADNSHCLEELRVFVSR